MGLVMKSVAPAAKAASRGIGAVEAADHQDRTLLRRWRRAQAAAGFKTVESRHHSVDQDEVRQMGLIHREGLGRVRGLQHAVTVALQRPTQHLAHGPLVIDHEQQRRIAHPVF